MKCCTFCGHKDVSPTVRPVLRKAVENLIVESSVTSFYVGNHGRFDSMVLGVLRELKEIYPQISYNVVLAYIPEKKAEYSSYDEGETLYPDGLENAPLRFAINHRNKWMVEHSDYLIAYVNRNFGGAAQTLEHAKRKKLSIIQLNDDSDCL